MKGKFILCIALLFCLIPACLHAQKSQDSDDLSLFEIDRLIRLTEYDEALKQLNIYIEKNPEKFDNAQTRIKRSILFRMTLETTNRFTKLLPSLKNSKSIRQTRTFSLLPTLKSLPSSTISAPPFLRFRMKLLLSLRQEIMLRLLKKQRKASGFIKTTFMSSGKIIRKLQNL